MLLNEFFGKSIQVHKSADSKRDAGDDLLNRLFYYTLEHDKIFKEYFFPIAKKIKKGKGMGKDQCLKEFMPMVERSCMEYYKANKMTGKLGKIFPKTLREELCEKLYNHYHEGIINDEYTVG